jgi:CHAT domain
MRAIDYGELRVRISRTESGAYRVFATGPTGEANGTFVLPFDGLELENFVLRIGRRSTGSRRFESSERQRLIEFGGRLFGALFQSDVLELYRSACESTRSEGKGLRISLALSDAPDLMNVPWEYLYDRPDFVSISAWTPIVRYLDLPRTRRPLQVTFPLRILAMVSSPTDAPQLDVAREKEKLEGGLRRLIDAGAIEIRWLEEATLRALLRELRWQPHVFHYIGHGAYDEQAGDGVLLLEDPQERGRAVTGAELGTLMADYPSLRLAVLNACEGARSSADDPFAGVAAGLVEREIPAVIAMQFEITDRAAIVFAEEFYWALADGYPVDSALAEARKAIFAEHNEVEWGTPVLFLRVPDGRIFEVPPPAERPHEPKSDAPEPRERPFAPPPTPATTNGGEAAPPLAAPQEEPTPAKESAVTGQRRSMLRNPRVLVPAAVAVAAAIGIGAWLGLSGGGGKPVPPEPGKAWKLALTSSALGGSGQQEMQGVAGFRGGLVGAGFERPAGRAVAWSYTRSSGWRAQSLGEGELYGIAASDSGAVAVGTAGPPGATTSSQQNAGAWRYDGDRDRWASVCGSACGDGASGGWHLGQTMYAIAARPGGGFVGVGVDVSERDKRFDAAVWLSDDGTTWQRVRPQRDFGGARNQVMRAVTVTRSGEIVAAGWDRRAAAVWLSVDGTSWRRVRSAAFSVPNTTLQMNSVVERGADLVAVGQAGDSQGNGNEAAIWILPNWRTASAQGRDWVRVEDHSLFHPGQRMLAVAAAGPGLVAAGYDHTANGNQVAAVWTSADGRRWTRSPHGPFATKGDTEIDALASARGFGLVAAGDGPSADGNTDSEEQDARIWIRH